VGCGVAEADGGASGAAEADGGASGALLECPPGACEGSEGYCYGPCSEGICMPSTAATGNCGPPSAGGIACCTAQGGGASSSGGTTSAGSCCPSWMTQEGAATNGICDNGENVTCCYAGTTSPACCERSLTSGPGDACQAFCDCDTSRWTNEGSTQVSLDACIDGVCGQELSGQCGTYAQQNLHSPYPVPCAQGTCQANPLEPGTTICIGDAGVDAAVGNPCSAACTTGATYDCAGGGVQGTMVFGQGDAGGAGGSNGCSAYCGTASCNGTTFSIDCSAGTITFPLTCCSNPAEPSQPCSPCNFTTQSLSFNGTTFTFADSDVPGNSISCTLE
jgi:hypothetical protein